MQYAKSNATSNSLRSTYGGRRASVRIHFTGTVYIRETYVKVHTNRLMSECEDSSESVIAPKTGMRNDTSKGRLNDNEYAFGDYYDEPIMTAQQEYDRDFSDRLATAYENFCREQ